MPKAKGKTWSFFETLEEGGVVCKFCNHKYKHGNVNKMRAHIVKNCLQCPPYLKNVLRIPSLVKNIDKSLVHSQENNLVTVLPGSSSSERPGSSMSTLSTSSGVTPFFDSMDPTINEKLNQYLAKAIFISGAPFSLVEHPLWIEFFKAIRSEFVPPSRNRLAGTYLDSQYAEIKNNVNSAVNNSKYLHLQCDGWSNLRDDSVINFWVSTPAPLFVDFIFSGEKPHTATYLYEQIEAVMKKYNTEKFLVIIGDNAANVRASFRLLQKKYPHIVPLGCLAHLLHLLCGDILNSSSIQRKMADVIQLIISIKTSHTLKAAFDQIGREKGVTFALKLPVINRWGSYLDCLKSAIINKSVIQTLAITEKTIITSEIKKKILNDIFWNHIQNMISLLEPIISLLIKVQSNEPQIHIVYNELTKLESILIKNINNINFEESEKDNIIKNIMDRKKFVLNDIHFAADLLNPSTQGCSLNPTQLLDAMMFIYSVGKHSHINEIKLRTELTNFRDKEDIWAKPILWEGHDSMPPLLWWRGLRGTCELADIAIRILSAPITSAATERIFSAFNWVHCKRRNRLTTTNAAKLTYLTYNHKLLNMHKSKNITDLEENDEVDIEDEELMIDNISSDVSDVI